MIKIGNKTIGNEPYVIAEFGVNHNGSLERAFEGIKKAAIAGADAIKFQTYTADELVVKGTPKFWDWEGDKQHESQYDAYKAIGGAPYEWYPQIMKCCEENNIEFLSTPFSIEAADYLNKIGMKAFKIASSDMSTIPFLEHVARFGKPIILSTGASTLEEIEQAVIAIEKQGNDKIILLHCTLSYPTKPEDANLNLIQTLKVFGYPVGLSDHTLSFRTSIPAVAIGAKVLEKHYTTDKTLPDSADHWLSVNPEELADYVGNAHATYKMMGSRVKQVFACEEGTRKYDKRSIVTKVAIPKGTVITREMLTFKRPGTGIWPDEINNVIGMVPVEDIKEDTTLTWEKLTKTTE